MATRESDLAVTHENTLWLVVHAIRAVPGATAGAEIDQAMKAYDDDPDDSQVIGARLDNVQLGVFDANQTVSFDDFFEAFANALIDQLVKFNWVDPNTQPASLAGWKIDTSLGTMEQNLVSEFIGTVVATP